MKSITQTVGGSYGAVGAGICYELDTTDVRFFAGNSAGALNSYALYLGDKERLRHMWTKEIAGTNILFVRKKLRKLLTTLVNTDDYTSAAACYFGLASLQNYTEPYRTFNSKEFEKEELIKALLAAATPIILGIGRPTKEVRTREETHRLVTDAGIAYAMPPEHKHADLIIINAHDILSTYNKSIFNYFANKSRADQIRSNFNIKKELESSDSKKVVYINREIGSPYDFSKKSIQYRFDLGRDLGKAIK